VQTYGRFRLVVSDDSTEDEPGRIVRSYAERDQRIDYLKNKDRKGMVDNWRACFDLCPGADYFAWVADHDIWHPDWLETMIRFLDHHPDTVLVYPKTVNIDIQGKRKDKKTEKRLPLFSTIGLSDADRVRSVCKAGRGFGSMVYGLFRTEALRRAGVFRRLIYPDVILINELSFLGDIHQVDAELWYRRRTARFSIARQKKSLFVKKPWYFFLPWPFVNAGALMWNTALKSDIEFRTPRWLGIKAAWMYLRRWLRKLGTGSWIGSYHEWVTGQKPWIKKIKTRLREKNA
jgi:glycosyltransferase involved in cell wall biosynthesis